MKSQTKSKEEEEEEEEEEDEEEEEETAVVVVAVCRGHGHRATLLFPRLLSHCGPPVPYDINGNYFYYVCIRLITSSIADALGQYLAFQRGIRGTAIVQAVSISRC